MISDWSDLQTVLSIARSGSLSAAARELGLSQSTVSRRVQAIERQLNGQIFVRRADGTLAPSVEGNTLIAAAEKMEAAFLDATTALSGTPQPIRVATCEVMAKTFVVPTLSHWSAETRGIAEVSVHDDLFVLPDDNFDVLVTPLESAPADMVGRRIGELKWSLFVSPAYLSAHPVRAKQADLAGHYVIRSSGPFAGIAACRWFERLGGRPVFSASSPAAQLEAAANGSGIALLPESFAKDDPRIVRIEFPRTPVSDVWVVSRRSTSAQPRVAAFLKWFGRHYARRQKTPAIK